MGPGWGGGGGGGLVHFWVNVPNVACQMSPVANLAISMSILRYSLYCRMSISRNGPCHVTDIIPHVDRLHVAYRFKISPCRIKGSRAPRVAYVGTLSLPISESIYNYVVFLISGQFVLRLLLQGRSVL